MPKGVYVSDVDVEMSKDVESLRIDRHLGADLASALPGRRRRMVDRIEEHGRKNPMAIVPVLVKYHNHDHPKVRRQVRESLARLTQSESGEQALIECMFSRNPVISRTAAAILEGKNYNSQAFHQAFRRTEDLVVQARTDDVFSKDIEELVVDSLETYREGRFEQALTNMMMAKELMEDRLEWHRHMKNYVKDVLRLTPTLGRSGVQVDSIQDSVRSATSALQSRTYDDARMLLDLRREETRLWKQLWSLEEYVTRRIKAKPITELMVLHDSDKQILDAFMRMAGDVGEKIQDRDPVSALRLIEKFIREDVSAGYLATEGKRLDAGDEASWHAMWSTGLGLLKLLAPVIPNVAEEFYQQYFRDREGPASVHSVAWPEPFADLGEPVPSKAKEKRARSKK